MTTVNVHAAKTHLSKLIKRALEGEDVVIARGRTPVVRLVPVESVEPKREFGSLKGKLVIPDSFFEPLPESELEKWEK